MSFASPDLLFGLIAVPIVLVGYWLLDVQRAKRAAMWSRPALLPNTVESARGFRLVPVALFILGLTLLLVGFARPQFSSAASNAEPPTVALTFDLSGSMAAEDVKPTRIANARALAVAFVHELPATYRIAVVTFGDTVRLVVPPTLDRSRIIAELPGQITSRSGTSLGDGISAAVAAITETTGSVASGSGKPGAILLLSDGTQTAGGTTPSGAAAIASIERVPVDTVTIGTRAGVVTQPLSVDGLKSITQIAVPSSPTTMTYIARETGGTPFDVTSPAQLTSIEKKLSVVYQGLGATTQPVRNKRDLSAAAGGVALVLILAAIIVSSQWFARPA